jgi:hypothetical protein
MRIPKTEKLFKRFLLWSFERVIVLDKEGTYWKLYNLQFRS